MSRVEGVRLSLWRAVTVYRVATLLFADYLIFVRWPHLYARPAVAFAVGAVMAVGTGVLGWLAVTGRAHRPSIVVGDAVVTFGLTLLTILAQTDKQQHGDMPTLTTLWAAGPVLEAGIVGGPVIGVLAALVQSASTFVVHEGYDGRTVVNLIILLIAGSVVGYVTRLVVRSENQLAAAVAARTALSERERLARTVHDGVLQVLGLVHRTGADEPGRWGRLAAEAGAQESRLRALLTSTGAVDPEQPVDVLAALRSLRSDSVTVAAPASLPPLPPHASAELVAAVNAALHNVERHAGADAHAWVLLEELDDAVQVTVRDDGAGFGPDRLPAARAEGRLGVASSVHGRITDLGGTAVVTSVPGRGTTVALTVPLPPAGTR